MNRPKDDSSNPATLARLAVKQEQARNREAASLACANAKAQEREALNIFARLPLARKLAALNLAPARPATQSRPPLATLAAIIRGATDKTRKTREATKDGENEES